ASANSLRAYGGLKAADYAVPVLGLIFLRFADNKYSHYEAEINAEYKADKGTRLERSIQSIALTKCGFYLPTHARYDYLLNLEGEKSLAKALREAMEGIEEYQDEKFKDVLPKEAFFDIEKKKADILPSLLKTFSDIPKDASGDIFGKIYEYFLGKFAMSEGQKGGEFFTPTSVVRFIVEVIEPYAGKIYDPACGSGGMFVQSAKFIQEANHDLSDIYVCGQEYMGETVRLAKMNLMVNNIRGEITETNSYENDPYTSFGKFDFVMANPPFNVKSVKESTVKNDERFYTYGLPKNKGKNTDDSITDANYLWVSLFATSLNDNGRAGFVMPNSASDAGNSEYEIRKKIVDSGIVDCMVSMPSNMFFTVTLPATLWFFDKRKCHPELVEGHDRKDKILFLDARNTYYQIDRAHREWKEEHIQNLSAIVRLYRGETDRYLELIQHYLLEADAALNGVEPLKVTLENQLQNSYTSLLEYVKATKAEKRTPAKTEALQATDFHNKLDAFTLTKAQQNDVVLNKLLKPIAETPLDNSAQLEAASHVEWSVTQNKYDLVALKNDANTLLELWKIADSNLKLKTDKAWVSHGLNRTDKAIEYLLTTYTDVVNQAAYWNDNISWLQSRFPNAVYTDVVGLCKMADQKEYAEEQDYSLNAGRYVGVEIDGEDITKAQFQKKFKLLLDEFNQKSNSAIKLSEQISQIGNTFLS
ncbi:N-6 DNA methylase, partial [bacterium]|nr:N-6 DNA methylase [bacterium]